MLSGLPDDRQDVALVENQQFLAVHLDFRAGVAGEQHLVVLGDLEFEIQATVEG